MFVQACNYIKRYNFKEVFLRTMSIYVRPPSQINNLIFHAGQTHWYSFFSKIIIHLYQCYLLTYTIVLFNDISRRGRLYSYSTVNCIPILLPQDKSIKYFVYFSVTVYGNTRMNSNIDRFF